MGMFDAVPDGDDFAFKGDNTFRPAGRAAEGASAGCTEEKVAALSELFKGIVAHFGNLLF